MSEIDFSYARLHAEVLRMQRWAGGKSIPVEENAQELR